MNKKRKRREFLKLAGMAGIGLSSAGILQAYSPDCVETGRKLNKVKVDKAVATLEDGTVLATPFWRVDSGKEGPSLLLVASQHGHEIQGAEVARRLMEIASIQLVSGSVWLVPMANILAVRSRKHSIDLGPEKRGAFSEGHNMQSHWPGDPEGNNTARLAYALNQTVLKNCSHAVDMHCWQHVRAAQTLSVYDHQTSYAMGEVTTTRFIHYNKAQLPQGPTMSFNILMRNIHGGSSITLELSGQYEIHERQVQIGLTSMVNIAKMLGMIEGEPELIRGPRPLYPSETNVEVDAPVNGIFMPALRKNETTATLIPEDFVEEGQSLGHIIRDNDLEIIPIVSPVSGYLWQYGVCHWGNCGASLPAQHNYVEKGDRIAIIDKIS
jgi:predicted deacylase